MTRSHLYGVAGAIVIGGICLFVFIAYVYPFSIKLEDSGECPKIGIVRRVTVVGYFGSPDKIACKLGNGMSICFLPFSSIPNAKTKFFAAVELYRLSRTNFPLVDDGSLGPNDRVIITGTVIRERECTVRVEKIERSH